MRIIPAAKIRAAVRDLCVQANLVLRQDVLRALKSAYAKESNPRAKKLLWAIIENARLAKANKLAICQDTGMPVIFVELGSEVRISGDLKAALERAVEDGYRRVCLRNSIVSDPLSRGKPKFSPPVVHYDLTRGNKIKLTVLPKGFGCENKSALKMFKPTAGIDEIKQFIVETVKAAGPDACPPYIVGVGIGGTADYACLLAKKALLSKVKSTSQKFKIVKLENDLLLEINKLDIGPMGLGGKATALAVNILTYPTHIAGLPVAVNISCHALRSAKITL